MIKRHSLLIILLIIGVSVMAQIQVAPDKYWIQFTDKSNTPYSIDRPDEFLSERAIQRRKKYI